MSERKMELMNMATVCSALAIVCIWVCIAFWGPEMRTEEESFMVYFVCPVGCFCLALAIFAFNRLSKEGGGDE